MPKNNLYAQWNLPKKNSCEAVLSNSEFIKPMLNKTAKIIKAFLGNFIFLNSVFVLFDMVKTEVH